MLSPTLSLESFKELVTYLCARTQGYVTFTMKKPAAGSEDVKTLHSLVTEPQALNFHRKHILSEVVIYDKQHQEIVAVCKVLGASGESVKLGFKSKDLIIVRAQQLTTEQQEQLRLFHLSKQGNKEA